MAIAVGHRRWLWQVQAGQDATFTLYTRDACGNVTHDASNVRVRTLLEAIKPRTSSKDDPTAHLGILAMPPVFVTSNDNGSHSIRFTTMRSAKYALSVWVNDLPISEQPEVVSIIPGPACAPKCLVSGHVACAGVACAAEAAVWMAGI